MRKAPVPLVTLALLAAAVAIGPAFADSPPSVPTPVGANDLDGEVERLDRELRTLDTQLDDLRKKSDLVKKRILLEGRSYYRMVHAGLLPLSSGFENLSEHARRVEHLRHALERDASVSRLLQDRQQALSDRRQKLQDRKTPLEARQKAVAQARALLLEADDRQRAFDRAFSAGGDYLAVYGANAAIGPSDSLAASSGFASMRGRLPFPLSGRSEVRVVQRAGASGPGVEMRAPVGSPVRTVFAGRVAFADEYASYGRVVIVDHGDNYFSVSGNLSSVDVRVGEDLAAGARIGAVGTIDGRGALYFELRRGADTLDPSPWLGL
jgi:septal ring factor EnvC (AmiA/AmiB activator)